LSSSNGSAGFVELVSTNTWGSNAQTFQMGTTNVVGTSSNPMFFIMTRDTPGPFSPNSRVVFNNTNSFNISGDGTYLAALLTGDGIIQAGNAINVTNGAVLGPFDVNTLGSPTALSGTLTLEAPTVNLNNFALAAQVGYTMPFPVGSAQMPLIFDPQGIPISNNDLLNINSTNVNMSNGMVFLNTATGTPFSPGDYLLIRSTNGFNGITNNTQHGEDKSVSVK